jgi:hypothetical protein
MATQINSTNPPRNQSHQNEAVPQRTVETRNAIEIDGIGTTETETENGLTDEETTTVREIEEVMTTDIANVTTMTADDERMNETEIGIETETVAVMMTESATETASIRTVATEIANVTTMTARVIDDVTTNETRQTSDLPPMNRNMPTNAPKSIPALVMTESRRRKKLLVNRSKATAPRQLLPLQMIKKNSQSRSQRHQHQHRHHNLQRPLHQPKHNR